jgi:hypothetical protein
MAQTGTEKKKIHTSKKTHHITVMNVSKLWLLQCDAIKNIQQVTLG